MLSEGIDLLCETRRWSLTAVDFVRSAVVPAVVHSIAHKVNMDTAAVGAGELSVGVTGGERAASLVAVVTTIIGVVAGKAQWHTAAVVTGEVHRRAGVKGLARGTTELPLIVEDDKVSNGQSDLAPAPHHKLSPARLSCRHSPCSHHKPSVY